MCLHCLGNFAQVRKVMMATTATMIVLTAVYILLIIIRAQSSDPEEAHRRMWPIFFFLDLVRLAVWTAYLVYMSGVLNRLPNGKGYKVLGAELGRIFVDATQVVARHQEEPVDEGEQPIVMPSIIALIHLIVFAYVFFVFKKSEVKDPQELLTACQGCPCTPLPISPPAQGQVVMGAPVMGAPVMGAPVMGAPVMGAPVKGAPVMGDPVMGAPVMGAPVMGAPVMGAPVTGAPPVMGAPVVGAPITGGPEKPI